MNGIFLLVAAINVYRLWGPASLQANQADFHTYYLAARAVRAGHSPYDQTVAWMQATLQHRPDTPQLGQISLFVYPPLLAFVLIPLTFMPYPAALAVWNLCNLVLLAACCYLVLRIAGLRMSATILLGLVAAALFLSPVHSELYFAQADLALLCLVCASVWAIIERHPKLGGCLLAVACAVKPVLLILLLFFVWKRAYRAAAASAVGFFTLLLVPFVWLGPKALADQVAIWRFWSSHYATYFFNVSPNGLLARLFDDNIYVAPVVRAPAVATILWLVIAAVVVGVMLLLIGRAPMIASPRTALELGIVVTGLLLVSPLSEDWYFSFLIVPLLASAIMVRASAQSHRTTLYLIILLGIGLLLCLPLFHIQGAVLDRIMSGHTSRLLADVLMIASAVQLYLAIALLVVQGRILQESAAVHPVASLRQGISGFVTWARSIYPSLAWVRAKPPYR
jgi:alpha-1,2-mannosyltransferase